MHPMATGVAQRLEAVRQRLRQAEVDHGRPPGSVTLLAVSKTHDAESIRAAWAAGQRRFGENYLQEALDKMARLADLPIEWHFIGRLQANKTRPIAERFAWVHSLCDPQHAQRLNDQRPPELPPLNVCVQVNLDGEASKAGLPPERVAELLERCRNLPRLRPRGLMTLPAPTPDPVAQRRPLRQLRELRDRLARPEWPLDCLSMGMSDDLEAAVAEGTTLVRIGTAIFGSRAYVQP